MFLTVAMHKTHAGMKHWCPLRPVGPVKYMVFEMDRKNGNFVNRTAGCVAF